MVPRTYDQPMHFGVLGPLVVRGPQGPLDLVGGKERMLLAHLVAAAGRMVSVDELSDSLWGDRPPRAPGKALQTYVLRVRNVLEPDRRGVPTIVITEGTGYRLDVTEHDIDALVFLRLATAGSSAVDEGRPDQAAPLLTEALSLWRGPAYAGFEECAFARSERQRLDELHTSAREDLWAAEVDLGRSAGAVPELERLVGEHPWRERAWAILVLALCRAGRQGDALGALDRARRRLADDLGVDPGPQLQQLQARVLAHDPQLLVLPALPAHGEARPVIEPGVLAASRAEATASVRAGTGTVAAATDALRDGRAALVEGIYTLQTTGQSVDLPPDVCPWRGLASYTVEDRPWFAGRERLVAEMLARLSSDRVVAVIGASGSGKSSLVRAGLLGALADGALPGSAHWTTLVMRPGSAPMRELATVALGAAHDVPLLGDLLLQVAERGYGVDETDTERRTVLVVDQLEEVWTACEDERERDSFLDALAGIAHETDTRVVLVVRGDYFSRLADHSGLAVLARDASVLVGAPTPAEVRRMIEVPARAAALELEAGLAETITDDAGQEPGLLPLLSTSLMQLWERRDGARLTYDAYIATGGLPAAVAHLAEEAYESLGERERVVARVVLLRLAGHAGGGEVVRRRVALPELAGLPGPVVDVVAALAGARLLTVADDAVEVAHESLFREWPRLAGWLADDATARTVLHRLAVAAGQWDVQGRESGLLWRGAGLQSALEIARTHPEETTAVERDFLDEGEAALEAERRSAEERAVQRERQNRVLRGLLGAASVLLVLAVVAGVLALLSRQETAQARDRQARAAVAAEARRLAAASLNEEGLDLGLLQAVEAVRTEPGPQTHGALLTLLARTPDLVRLRRGETPYLRAAASADGNLVAVAEFDPRVMGLDAVSGEEVWSREVADGGHVFSLHGGPRGFLVQAWDDLGGAAVHLWDARTGADIWSVRPDDLASVVGPDGDPYPAETVWDARGRPVVLTPTHLVRLSPRGRPLRAMELPGSPPAASLLLAWPDGRMSFQPELGQGETRVIDPDRPGDPGVRVDADVYGVSPDGRLLLSADQSDVTQVRLRLLDTTTFRAVGEEMTVSSFDNGVDWSQDGRTFAIGAGEVVEIRDRRGRLVRELAGAHSGAVMQPVFAGPDDGVLWAAGRDGLMSTWDLSRARGLIVSTPIGASPFSGQASTDGARVVALDLQEVELNRAHLLDPATGEASDPLPVPAGCQCQVWAVAMAGDGSVAVGAVNQFDESGLVTDRGHLVVWDAVSGDLLDEIDTPWDPADVGVTPDGARAVINGRGGIAVVDLATGELVGPTAGLEELAGPEGPVRVDPDGRTAAVVRGTRVLLLDVASGKVRRTRDLGSASRTAAVGSALGWADGDLVVGGLDGRLVFLDGETLDAVAPPREASAGFVVDLLQVGDVVASLGTDGDVRVWDPVSWSPVGMPVTEENTMGFLSGDGDTLRAWFEGGTQDSTGRVRDIVLDPQRWTARACTLTGRQLTKDEWDVIHPGQAWRQTCPAA